jgi:hypothetical protein
MVIVTPAEQRSRINPLPGLTRIYKRAQGGNSG